MTAKIDTQAPGIGMTTGIDFGTGKDTTMLTLMIDGKLDHASTDGPWGQAILALLAERDLSAAREAAAAQAMREAAIARAKDLPISEIAVDEVVYAIDRLPLPDTTALDRLIAERVREAFAALDECLEWMEQLRASGDAGFWEWQPGDAYNKGMALIARGSKEGRDV